MRIILDTHALFWSVDEPAKLSLDATAAILDPMNERLIRAATVWELAIKYGQGKIKLSLPFRTWMTTAIADLRAAMLPVTVEYADRQATLPPHHKDPFDRMLIAQALEDAIPIVSADGVFDAYGVTRIW